MKAYRVTGNMIGPDDAGACYFPTLALAQAFLREENRTSDNGIEVIEIGDQYELAEALNDAMGYGGT